MTASRFEINLYADFVFGGCFCCLMGKFHAFLYFKYFINVAKTMICNTNT